MLSTDRRALLALAALIGGLVLAALTGAAQPTAELSVAASISDALPTTTAEPSPLPPTATPLPTPAPSPTLARRELPIISTNPKLAPTAFLPGRGPAIPGELIYTGRWIDVYVGGGTFSEAEVIDLGIKADYAVNYLRRRFDQELTRRISVGVYRRSQAPDRNTRGIAYTANDNLRIYYNSGEDTHNALVILTHEIAHQLQANAYGSEAQSRADIILLEGLATWISGEYWLSLSESPSFRARARELYQAGYRGNLATMMRSSGSADVAYEMWAGFCEYLAQTYGWDKFNALYSAGRGRAAGSADYLGIYGKSFAELAAEFQATLK